MFKFKNIIIPKPQNPMKLLIKFLKMKNVQAQFDRKVSTSLEIASDLIKFDARA